MSLSRDQLNLQGLQRVKDMIVTRHYVPDLDGIELVGEIAGTSQDQRVVKVAIEGVLMETARLDSVELRAGAMDTLVNIAELTPHMDTAVLAVETATKLFTERQNDGDALYWNREFQEIREKHAHAGPGPRDGRGFSAAARPLVRALGAMQAVADGITTRLTAGRDAGPPPSRPAGR